MTQDRFNASVAQHLEDSPCDLDNVATSLTRLTKCVTDAARETLPVRRSQPLRKRGKRLYEERQRAYTKMSDRQRVELSRAIAVSSRDDFRQYVHDVLDDIEMAESVGNIREVSKLTRILGHNERRGSCNPSKGADGTTITSPTQLLSEWDKFLGTKCQRPAADAHQNLESLPPEDDVLDDDELRVCLKAKRSGKATGWDDVPVEAYRGSVEATNDLFRICRLMWRTEKIPPDLVRGVFMMIYKKGPRDDFANYSVICLLCHSYKLLSAVIARRLMEVLDGHLPDIKLLRWFITMVLRGGRNAVITFIDYSAAFDTESQIFLDSALADAGDSAKV